MEAYIDSCKAKDSEILNKAKNVQEKKDEDMTESKNRTFVKNLLIFL